jgi:hypothetical protein
MPWGQVDMTMQMGVAPKPSLHLAFMNQPGSDIGFKSTGQRGSKRKKMHRLVGLVGPITDGPEPSYWMFLTVLYSAAAR